jgi:uncharacterized protein
MDVAAQLKRARILAGLTQADVARVSGVPQPNISAIERNLLTPRPETVERLQRATRLKPRRAVDLFRDQIQELVTNHHGSNPRIFGSVARGEDQQGSDIDLLVDFDTEATYFDVVGLRLDLEELTGLPIDVVHDDGESPALVSARREAIPL